MPKPDVVNRIGNVLLDGMVVQMAPGLIKGALLHLLQNVSVPQACQWVEENRSLWKSAKTEHQSQMHRIARKAGNLDWLTVDWAIENLRNELPALASLFLGWKKGHNWLARQLEEIKREASADVR